MFYGKIACATVLATLPIAASATTLTFTEVVTNNIQAASNEYASYGVTFDNFYYYYDPRDTFDKRGISANTPAATINFTSPVSGVSIDFLSLANVGGGTVSLFTGASTLADTFVFAATGSNQNLSHDFVGSDISKLVVTPEFGGFFSLSTLRFSAATGAVPEPASWAMMVSGFGIVGGAMRRRQRVAVSFA